jgi:hypothetical protein
VARQLASPLLLLLPGVVLLLLPVLGSQLCRCLHPLLLPVAGGEACSCRICCCAAEPLPSHLLPYQNHPVLLLLLATCCLLRLHPPAAS